MSEASKPAPRAPTLSFAPLTGARWDDFETLFGPNGACAGCWCVLWRVETARWRAQKGAKNRAAMKALVTSGQVPGILAYEGREPVGWCSVQPRATLPGLARARVLKAVDDQPVWSITCFYIRRTHRGRGVSVALLKAACDFVQARGGRIVEGYPVEPPEGERYGASFAWTGLASAFRKAGFTEVLRRSTTRPIMRRALDGRR